MARWSLNWLRAHDVATGHVIDWGCGDGAAAVVFAEAGWQVTGIDQSTAMLRLAEQRSIPATWLNGDIRALRLTAPGLLATALYDTLNYLISVEDLQAAWHTLAASIATGGYVIVDVNTPQEYTTAWHNQHVITADTDDVLILNRLRYNSNTRIARGRITWFVREDVRDEWRRGSELHLQRAHTHAEMLAAIKCAGLTLVECCTPHGEAQTEMATRLIYIAHKT